MRIKQFPIILLTIRFITLEIFAQNVPSSPCPRFFRYNIEDQSIVGTLRVPSPELGDSFKIILELTLRASLPSRYAGSFELSTTRAQALQKMMRGEPIQYTIRFPVQSPLPRMKTITINGRIICVGMPEQGPVVTTIRLEHILYTKEAKRQQMAATLNKQSGSFDDYGSISNPKETIIQNPSESRAFISGDDYLSMDDDFQQPNPTVTPIHNFEKILAHARDEDICGVTEQITPLISGGKNIERGAWPWLAAIYTTDSTTLAYKCGGALISKRVIVTAAHCVNTGAITYAAQDVVVSLGRHNIRKWQLEEGAVIREAMIVTYHPDFMRSKPNSYDADIAVIVIRNPVKYSQFIRPICLWTSSNGIHSIEGMLGRVVGWGRDPQSNEVLTQAPKVIDVPIVSQEDCFLSHPVMSKIASNRTFCAGRRDDTGPCNGDSGGALAIKVNNRWTLRGIVSVAIPKANNICNLKHYVVFTDIAHFTDWLLMYVSI